MNFSRPFFSAPLLARELNGRASRWQHSNLWAVTLVLHTLFYLALAWIVRALCLAQSERVLRR